MDVPYIKYTRCDNANFERQSVERGVDSLSGCDPSTFVLSRASWRQFGSFLKRSGVYSHAYTHAIFFHGQREGGGRDAAGYAQSARGD